MASLRIVAPFLFLLMMGSPCSAEPNPPPSHGGEEGEISQAASPSDLHGEDAPAPRPKVFKGYSPYRDEFKEVCTRISEDGRVLLWETLLKSHSERDPFCPAFRPLMQALASGCSGVVKKPPRREKRETKVAEEEVPPEEGGEGGAPSVTPTPGAPKVQRDPAPALLDILSSTFSVLSEDKVRAEDSICAVQKLLFVLRQQPSLSPGEREYLDVVAEYIHAPFERLMKRADGGEGTEGPVGGHTAPPVNVDVLFDE